MARILFISHTSRLGSGAPYSLLKLLKYTSQQHKVAVVAPGDGDLFGALEQIGIPGHWAGPHGLTQRCIPRLCQLIVGGKFDLVYGNNYSAGPRNALVAAKLTGRPYVWHIREMLRETEEWRTAFFLRYADVIIAVSRACAQSVKRHVPQKDIHVVYNGIEPEEFQLEGKKARRYIQRILGIPQKYLTIINVGTVCARKGQEYTIEVAAEFLKSSPETVFVFLGRLDQEPEYVQRLKEQATRLRIENNIRFLGFRTDIPFFLKGSDILLHTAVWDPNPRAILEAMGAELPVVTFAVDGVSEMVVGGETGYLIPFGDVRSMAETLGELSNNPTLRKRMGEMGREKVLTRFTADETAKRIMAFIQDIL